MTPLPILEERQVAIAGGTAPVFVASPMEDTATCTLLCVHGWTLDHRSFAAQQPLAAFGIAVASYDRRGFGCSALAPDFSREVEDLLAVVESLPSPVVLYGVSQGARLVLRFLANHADRVVGAAVQGGHLDGFAVEEAPWEAIPFADYQSWLSAGNLEAFRAHWLQHPLMSRGASEVQMEQLLTAIDAYKGSDLLTPGALPNPMDIREAISAISLPLLTVTGTLETQSRIAHADEIDRLAGGRRLTVEGGGHLCNFTHAESFNRGLLAWLRSVCA
jgi:pimeloyl-ACP methyl ester carboxylesterase